MWDIYQVADKVFQICADVIVLSLSRFHWLQMSIKTYFFCCFSLSLIELCLNTISNYWKNFNASSQNKSYSQPVVCGVCAHNTYQITHPLSMQTQYIHSVFSLCAPFGRCPHRDREKPLYLIAMLRILITLLPWKHNTVKEQLLREHQAAGGAISAPS